MNRRMTNSFTISPHEGSTEHDRTERKSIDRKLKNESNESDYSICFKTSFRQLLNISCFFLTTALYLWRQYKSS